MGWSEEETAHLECFVYIKYSMVWYEEELPTLHFLYVPIVSAGIEDQGHDIVRCVVRER
jgi:hypothetical protein